MKQLAYALFMMCIQETIPNPHTIEFLPKEQKQVIIEYAKIKCGKRINLYLDSEDTMLCEDYNMECM